MDLAFAFIIIFFVFWAFVIISLVVTKYLGWDKVHADEITERIIYTVQPPQTYLSKLKNLNRTDQSTGNQDRKSVDLIYQLEQKVPSALGQNKVKELTK